LNQVLSDTKIITHTLALLLSLTCHANDTEISAKEVLYLPEEERMKLFGDITLAFDGWTFSAEKGEFYIEEKKLFLQGDDHKKAYFRNDGRSVFGEANYIEVKLSESINLLGDAMLTSDSEIIKSNKINYRLSK